jgi:DNA-binding transcriptional MerR regulator
MRAFTFTPAEVCAVLEISKSTLLRWERDGQIPAADRDRNGERHYSPAHVAAIAGKALEARFELATRSNHKSSLDRAWEALSLLKFLSGQSVGLSELKEYRELSPRTLRELLLRAAELDPDDEQYPAVIGVVAKHSLGRSMGPAQERGDA